MQGLYKPLNLGLRGAADALSLVNHRYLEHAKNIALGVRAAGFLLPTILNVSKLVCEKEGLDGNPTCKSIQENKRSFRKKVVLHTAIGVIQCAWFISYLGSSRNSLASRLAETLGPIANWSLIYAISDQLFNRLADRTWEDKSLNPKTTAALVLDLLQAVDLRSPLPLPDAIPFQQITGLTSVSLQLWSWATKTK